MKYIDRESVGEPQSLSKPSDAVSSEMTRAVAHYLDYDPLDPKSEAYSFKEYAAYDVKRALEQMSHEKCAYCEGELGDGLHVEHFRPKGKVSEDDAHPGYWWLAHTWRNLLPSCNGCNQQLRQHLVTETTTEDELQALMAKRSPKAHGKGNQFPISGVRAVDASCDLDQELPDLIDPSGEDPVPFFSWTRTGPFSLIGAGSSDAKMTARALKSIAVYALNRAKLVKRRTRILNILRLQASQILDELEVDRRAGGSAASIHRALVRADALQVFARPESEFSTMAKAFIDEFRGELLASVGG